MRVGGWIVYAALCGSSWSRAQHYPLVYNPHTPEGGLLEHIEQASQEREREALLEMFVQRYPKHPAVPWAYDQLRSVYQGRNDTARVVAASEKLLEADPQDLYTAHQLLKIAEQAKDPSAVWRNADRAFRIAKSLLAGGGQHNPEFARQVATYVDYLYYTRALETQDAAQKLARMEEFLRRSPDSPYSRLVPAHYFATALQMGDMARAVAFAEILLKKEQNQGDALLLVAQDRFRKKIDADTVLAYSARVIDLVRGQSKPEGMSAEDWTRRKAWLLGSAYFMTGSVLMDQERYAAADRALRAALPFIRGMDMAAPALFYLAWANHQLKNPADALRFGRECAALRSPLQSQALRNLAVLQSEYKLP